LAIRPLKLHQPDTSTPILTSLWFWWEVAAIRRASGIGRGLASFGSPTGLEIRLYPVQQAIWQFYVNLSILPSILLPSFSGLVGLGVRRSVWNLENSARSSGVSVAASRAALVRSEKYPASTTRYAPIPALGAESHFPTSGLGVRLGRNCFGAVGLAQHVDATSIALEKSDPKCRLRSEAPQPSRCSPVYLPLSCRNAIFELG
jgi:hypothetical protein